MKVYIGSDHAGFELKQYLLEELKKKGFDVTDTGPQTLNPEDDFNQTLEPLIGAMRLADNADKAIAIGGSGQGEAMVCNRHRGLRAIVYYGGDQDILTKGHEHNDANVLALGARHLKNEEALEAVTYWLSLTTPVAEKYARRNRALDQTLV